MERSDRCRILFSQSPRPSAPLTMNTEIKRLDVREYPVDFGWPMMPGLIQIKQSKTGLFGKGTVSIEGNELVLRGKMLWNMWLRLLAYVVMAAILLLVVWIPVILVLKFAGPPPSLPPDASAGDALVAWVGMELAALYTVILPLLAPAFVAEFLLFKQGEIRYVVAGAPVLGRFMPCVTVEVANSKRKRRRICLYFRTQDQARALLSAFGVGVFRR